MKRPRKIIFTFVKANYLFFVKRKNNPTYIYDGHKKNMHVLKVNINRNALQFVVNY